MFTPEIISKELLRQRGLVKTLVRFTNGTPEDTFEREFNFGLDVTSDMMRKSIKGYLDRIDAVELEIPNLPEGTVDLTGVVTEPTVDEQAFDAWRLNFLRLGKLQQLVDLGVIQNDNAQLVALRDTVRTGLQPEYLTRV